MIQESRHLSVAIDRPVGQVYDYLSNPANLAEWAAGLGSSVEKVDGQWAMDSPAGRVVIAFAPPNEFGVVDHDVTFPSGETFYNPMRVIAYGSGCEVVFSVRRPPELSDAEFERDAAAVATDLATLKRLLEGAAVRPGE